MWKKTVSIFLLPVLLLTCGAVSAGAARGAGVIKPEGGGRYKAVRLVPEIYNSAKRGLSDIRIKDSEGEDVPYFVNSAVQSASAGRESYALELINSYVKNDSFYFDYRLAAGREADTPATAIEFSAANTNFAKAAELYGSYDDINWEFIQNDRLYAVEAAVKLAIEFARPQKFTHYRLKLANNLERVAFSEVKLVYSVETVAETYFIESLAPDFTVESADKKTVISISGLKNLRLFDITLNTDSMFQRTVSAANGAGKELYNLSFNGASYADTTLTLGRYAPPGDIFTLTVADGDDRPIEIDGITVRYYADDIVFEGNAGEAYTLEFGAETEAPVYDIARYGDEILKGSVDMSPIGAITYAPAAEPAPARDYRTVFNIAVVAVALLLGAVILARLSKK